MDMTTHRVLLLGLAALVGLASSEALAQAPGSPPTAPTPTFTITGFIDELMTYSNNTSNFDFDLRRKDYLFYGRTRGRFDIVGEYGRAKAVLGLELDFAYGQTGSGNTNIATVQGGAVTAPTGAVAVFPAMDGSFGLNTDVRGILEIPRSMPPRIRRRVHAAHGTCTSSALAFGSASDEARGTRYSRPRPGGGKLVSE